MIFFGVSARATNNIQLVSPILYILLYHPVMVLKLSTTLDITSVENTPLISLLWKIL